MKIIATFAVVLLAALGAFGGLLYAHALPTSKIARTSRSAATALRTLGLYKATEPQVAAASSVPPTSTVHSSEAGLVLEQQSLDAEKAQIDAERSALELQRSHKAKAAASPPPALVIPAIPPMALSTPLNPKLADIYNSMGPDDLARIFAKEPDSDVVRSLAAMDERKAGKVMATLPPDRAAKVAALMDRSTPQSGNTP